MALACRCRHQRDTTPDGRQIPTPSPETFTSLHEACGWREISGHHAQETLASTCRATRGGMERAATTPPCRTQRDDASIISSTSPCFIRSAWRSLTAVTGRDFFPPSASSARRVRQVIEIAHVPMCLAAQQRVRKGLTGLAGSGASASLRRAADSRERAQLQRLATSPWPGRTASDSLQKVHRWHLLACSRVDEVGGRVQNRRR